VTRPEPDAPGALLQELVHVVTTVQRGTRKGAPGLFTPGVKDHVWRLAARYVDQAGLMPRIEAWVAEDGRKRYRGGRTSRLPLRALVVASIACGLSGMAIRYDEIRQVVADPCMSTVTRKLLGFSVSENPKEDRKLNGERQEISYHVVARRFTKLARLIDPKLFPARTALMDAEADRIQAQWSEAEIKTRQQRMDEFNRRLITEIFASLPESVRAAYAGDVTIDGTVVPVFGKNGSNTPRRLRGKGSRMDTNCGWHVKDPDQRDPDVQGSARNPKFTWAYEAHLAEMTGDGVGVTFPRLIVGFSLDRPGQNPGPNAIALLESLATAGYRAGTVTVDCGYSQLSDANFAGPLRALGYTLICDYRENELGVQAEHHGALLIEGAWYGACIPEPLRSATKDLRAGRIDGETYRRRIAEREVYLMRSQEVVRDGEATRYRCPAQGKGATLQCPLRRSTGQDDRRGASPRAVPLPLSQVPLNPPDVCNNRSSTTIPSAVGRRRVQAVRYGTPEWHTYYSQRRNQIEGANRRLKNGAQTNIGEPDRRRVRGLGKQTIIIALYILVSNLVALANFTHDFMSKLKDPPRRPGRPAKTQRSDSTDDDAEIQPLRMSDETSKRRRTAPEKGTIQRGGKCTSRRFRMSKRFLGNAEE
jgi:hypothetical protein